MKKRLPRPFTSLLILVIRDTIRHASSAKFVSGRWTPRFIAMVRIAIFTVEVSLAIKQNCPLSFFFFQFFVLPHDFLFFFFFFEKRNSRNVSLLPKSKHLKFFQVLLFFRSKNIYINLVYPKVTNKVPFFTVFYFSCPLHVYRHFTRNALNVAPAPSD